MIYDEINFVWHDASTTSPIYRGDYFCLRYGMPWKPEIITFEVGEAEFDEEGQWYDDLGTMNGGGGGVPCSNDLTEKQKHWRRNYGKVTHWFPSPDRPE